MNDITDFIASIETFANTMTTLMPKIAMIAGLIGFLMTAFFAMRVVAK